MLLRKFTWDLTPCSEVMAYMRVLGLIPPSAEGAEIEHTESHRRIMLQDPVQQRVMVYAAMSARVLAALALRLGDGPLQMPAGMQPDQVVETVTSQFTQTIHVATSVIIANMLDQGYLQLGPKVTEEATAGV